MSPIKVRPAIKKPHAAKKGQSVRSVKPSAKVPKPKRKVAMANNVPASMDSEGANPSGRATLSSRLKQVREALKDVGEVIPLPKGTINRLENGDESALLQVQEAVQMNGHSPINNEIEDRYTQTEDPTGGEFDSAVSALQQAADASIPQQSSLKDELFKEENIDMKTRLSPRLVTKLQIAEMEAREHHTPLLWEFCQGIKGKRVSLLGEGRKEGVEMEKAGNIGGLSVDGFNRTKG